MTEHNHLFAFPGTAQARIGDVGGKARSLIAMCSAGHAVPPGIVIGSAFFAPWIALLLNAAAWQALLAATPAEQSEHCMALKQLASTLPLSPTQSDTLSLLHERLHATAQSRYAVRSSATQEDLQGASFAGGYLTVLSVAADDLEEAVRSCFASIFDQRVVAYKVARRMPLGSLGMAVIVQEQIHSDVAGVSFSLNPLNNDFDQAVIDANWGLGETVVAGEVVPDHWVVDKHPRQIVAHARGDKQKVRRIGPDGVLREHAAPTSPTACLSDEQVLRVVDLIARVERDVGYPVDIEWAIADERLYLLQARPITAYVPLPASLQTAAGARRRLYIDIALSSGFTTNAPISQMGLSLFGRLATDLAALVFGAEPQKLAASHALLHLDGGRMYMDLSNVLWISSPRQLARKLALTDAATGRTLQSIDSNTYRAVGRPSWARWSMLFKLPGMLWRVRRLYANLLRALLMPNRSAARFALQQREFAALLHVQHGDLPLSDAWERCVRAHLAPLFEQSMAALGAGILAVQAFAALSQRWTRADPELAGALSSGFPGNVVVDMHEQMQRIRRLLPTYTAADLETLISASTQGMLPESAQAAWNAFMRRYGCRGPAEMDIAQPRYADSPAIAWAQILAMPLDTMQSSGHTAERQIARRHQASATVIAKAGPLRARLLRHLQCVIDRYAGERDTPKLHLLRMMQGLREQLMREGRRLEQRGQLERAEHIFDLSWADAVRAASAPSIDCRARRRENIAYTAQLPRLVRNFPAVIDSRGRIHRAPALPCGPGEYAGCGLSAGVARGPARTLRTPHDGPLLPGEILIAYTTDPGWTPLFANAAAIVLEIGGALQHGAVVAREFGLPCIAGIADISTAIADGTMLEVDGASGRVRVLERPAAHQTTAH